MAVENYLLVQIMTKMLQLHRERYCVHPLLILLMLAQGVKKFALELPRMELAIAHNSCSQRQHGVNDWLCSSLFASARTTYTKLAKDLLNLNQLL
jgi:hypothetical protein